MIVEDNSSIPPKLLSITGYSASKVSIPFLSYLTPITRQLLLNPRSSPLQRDRWRKSKSLNPDITSKYHIPSQCVWWERRWVTDGVIAYSALSNDDASRLVGRREMYSGKRVYQHLKSPLGKNFLQEITSTEVVAWERGSWKRAA